MKIEDATTTAIIISPGAAIIPAAATAADLVADFLRGRSPVTIRAYRHDLEAFAAFAGLPSAETALEALLSSSAGEANRAATAYKNAMIEAGLSPATINRRLASLRSFVKLSRKFGRVTWGLEVENVTAESYRDTKGPGDDGFRKLWDAIDGRNAARAARDRAILRVLHDLGLRRAEVVGLDVADVGAAAVSVLRKGKREKVLVSVPAVTMSYLSSWLDHRGHDDGPLFISFDRARKGSGRMTGKAVYDLVASLGRRAGVKARPHGIRHTAITRACRLWQAMGRPLEEVLQFSGHSPNSIAVLMKYRDRENDVQGEIATLVASDSAPITTTRPHDQTKGKGGPRKRP
jgi:integrase/recombinase XerC